MTDYTDVLSVGTMHLQMQRLAESKGWHVSEDKFWRMHWRTEENSVFIANCDTVDPHAHYGDEQYCVESYGPDVTSGEDVDFWYYDDIVEAMNKVLNLMDKDSR